MLWALSEWLPCFIGKQDASHEWEQRTHAPGRRVKFDNLPETADGRWGQGLTAEKMKECVWLRPEAIAQIEFLEWTGADHLRHTRFVALRDDKDPRKVVRET
jgi:ATP-dependent DNA ligase